MVPEIMKQIPETLFKKLEESRQSLSRQGSIDKVETNGRIVWRLRFREPKGLTGPKQKSILLGSDPEVVEAVRELINSWGTGKRSVKNKVRKRKIIDVEKETKGLLCQMFKEQAVLLRKTIAPGEKKRRKRKTRGNQPDGR